MSTTITALSAIGSLDRTADVLVIVDVSLGTTFKVTVNNLLGITGSPLGTTDSQNVSNKTLLNSNTATFKDTLFTIQDDGDATKLAAFQASGITTGTTRTYTFPNRTGTLATLEGNQTFTGVLTATGAQLTTPTINNPTLNTNTVNEFTADNGVTVDGLNIHNGQLNTNNSVVTANITDAAVTPAKLIAGTGSGWGLSSWTPTFVNITPGNGTYAFSYIQIGKLVIAHISFKFGTTSTMGSNPTFTLPVTSSSNYLDGQWIGGLRIVAGGAGFSGYVQWHSTTTAFLLAENASATYVSDVSANFTSAIPGTWTTNDYFGGTIFYEAA